MAKVPTEIKSLARSYTELAIQTLAGITQNGTSESARVQAASILLDRGWGKAEQRIESDTTIRYVAEVPNVAETTEQWLQHQTVQ